MKILAVVYESHPEVQNQIYALAENLHSLEIKKELWLIRRSEDSENLPDFRGFDHAVTIVPSGSLPDEPEIYAQILEKQIEVSLYWPGSGSVTVF